MKLASEKKLQRHMIRFLMVDSLQTYFNAISQALETHHYIAQGKLLDDLSSFEKALNLQWDVIIFNNAYDFDYKKALTIIEDKGKNIPLILLSDLDPTYPDILEAYQLGTYVVSSPINYDFLTLNIYRASVYTRLVRREHQLSLEIDNLQQQTQTLVETTEHAVATFQEGVHVASNDQYAKLFNIPNPDDLLGLPVLDILQPQNVLDFKQQFKRLSKGDFTQANFTIQTQNTAANESNLALQFSSTEFEGEPALQLVILNEGSVETTLSSTEHGFTSLEQISTQISAGLIEKNAVGLLTFTLNNIPAKLLEKPWVQFSQYCKIIEKNLLNTVIHKIVRIAEHVFIAIIPIDDEMQFNHIKQTALQQLPKTADVHGNILTVELSLGQTIINTLISTDQITDIIIQAQQNKVSVETNAQPLSLSLEHDNPPKSIVAPKIEEPVITPAPSGLSLGEIIVDTANDQKHNPFASTTTTTDGSHISLLEQIEQNTVKLHFQQLYDKEDIDTHLYEVSASFTHDGNTIDLESYDGLDANPELAMKLDRWVLVEASKRLHQFLSTCPKARIIVNMHAASFTDSGLTLLLTKLVSLINSKYNKPLILQFSEEKILTDMENATQFIQSAQEYGIGFTAMNFGESAYSHSILSHLKLIYAKLSPKFSDYLLSDDGLVDLQEKLDTYRENHPEVKFVIPTLDDMTKFANAWNVDIRYLQGNYFQAKQATFIDNAS